MLVRTKFSSDAQRAKDCTTGLPWLARLHVASTKFRSSAPPPRAAPLGGHDAPGSAAAGDACEGEGSAPPVTRRAAAGVAEVAQARRRVAGGAG
eukprot:SAG31_NODE_8661_length_1411_cov_1.456555_1_plen_94_part_00